ncbi:UNVERIFIED_ORG: 4-oxalocrotonate tautomerase [Paraburkholderia sediminicola]|nr:4-oxalocrotonate tautomerase [Paraburkholderia sediminicola]
MKLSTDEARINTDAVAIKTHFFKEFVMPVVRVSWFEGKDSMAKKAVAAEITESIVKNTGTDPKYIYVIFEDVAPSNWAGAGQLLGESPVSS